MSQQQNVLFPIETINRELDFKLFLSVLFAAPSRRVFVGQHDVLDSLLPQMQGGIYLGKNLFKSEFPGCPLDHYRALKQRGFVIVHLDEEGAIYAGGEDEWRRMLDRRLDIGVLDENDVVCAWGKFQAAHFAGKSPAPKARVIPIGHPRFDLYKPPYRAYFEEDAEPLRKRYGRFLLVNTNLTLANNALGLNDTFSPRCYYQSGDPVQRMTAVRGWAHISTVLANFVALVHRLSIEFPDLCVVLRPHPSEDQSFYETVFNGVPNVHVVHEGPVGPWIVASEAVIHDGCTTAIEGYFADKPVVNYKSVSDRLQDLRIPNQFGVRCQSEEEVLSVVRELKGVTCGRTREGASGEAHELMANFDRDAFEPLLNQMEAALGRSKVAAKSPSQSWLQMKDVARSLTLSAKGMVRPFFPAKMRQYAALRYQFYGFDAEVIGKKMDRIQRMTGKKVVYQQIGDSLIMIDAA